MKFGVLLIVVAYHMDTTSRITAGKTLFERIKSLYFLFFFIFINM